MRSGLFIAPFHRPSSDPGAALRRDLELLEAADRLGFAEAWVGEHHSGGWEIIGSPEVFVAAGLARTSRMAVGFGVVALPLHNPLFVAERFSTLEHLFPGRVLLGLGSGALPADAALIGVDRDEGWLASADAVLDLLIGQEVTRTCGAHRLVSARVQSPWPGPKAPLISLATMDGQLAEDAGMRGWGLLALAPGLSGRQDFALRIENACRKGLDRARLAVAVNIHVARERSAALEEIREDVAREQYEYWSGTLGAPIPEGAPERQVERMLAAGRLVAGSVPDCVELLRGLVRDVGGVGAVLVAVRDWGGQQASLRSLEIFATEVWPEVMRDVGHGGIRPDRHARAPEFDGRT